MTTAELPRPDERHTAGTAHVPRPVPDRPLLAPPAPLRNGPLRCPSCELGLVVLEVLGDLRFRCEHCILEWRYCLGQLWSVGDGLGDPIP